MLSHFCVFPIEYKKTLFFDLKGQPYWRNSRANPLGETQLILNTQKRRIDIRNITIGVLKQSKKTHAVASIATVDERLLNTNFALGACKMILNQRFRGTVYNVYRQDWSCIHITLVNIHFPMLQSHAKSENLTITQSIRIKFIKYQYVKRCFFVSWHVILSLWSIFLHSVPLFHDFFGHPGHPNPPRPPQPRNIRTDFTNLTTLSERSSAKSKVSVAVSMM